MLDTIRRWLGFTQTELEPQEALLQLNSIAPPRYVPEEVSPEDAHEDVPFFVCRETVLNRNARISGYEFALSRKLKSRMLEKSALIRRTYDDAMLHNLAPLAVPSLLGERFAFIRLSADSLNNPLLEKFSNKDIVVIIVSGAATVDPAEMRSSLRHLAKKGIKFGWAIDRPNHGIAEFLHEADIIEIKTAGFDGIDLKMMCRKLRAVQRKPKLIASELQTTDDFNLCYQCGFDYFMGPFVSSRKNWHPAKSEINRLLVFEVLNMIRSDAELNVIADRLRTEPVLTFKLLRYINSPGIGLLQKINDIQQVLLVLGRGRFYRWLSLLLFDFKQPGYRERVLSEQALARARFMERLAGHGHVPAVADHLFITGLFSLLNVMIDQHLDEVLKQVSLPETVASALKGEPGTMLDALLLAVAIESGDTEEMATAAARCSLDAGEVTGLMLEALAWSQQVSAISE